MLNIFEKSSAADAWNGPKCASALLLSLKWLIIKWNHAMEVDCLGISNLWIIQNSESEIPYP